METSSYWLLFLSAAIAINLSPGPDLIYILSKTIAQGRKIRIASSLGVCSGALVHVFAAALGLSAILATSAQTTNFFRKNRHFSVWLDRILGSVLIGLGLRLAFTEHQTN